MKSGKQRKKEIKHRRDKIAHKKALKIIKLRGNLASRIPEGALPVDASKLNMGNSYDTPPAYYIDYKFNCIDCGAEAIWTAEQQKWWYEEIQAFIQTNAVRCYSCRLKIRNKKLAQKKHMEEMSKIRPHPNVSFFRKKF